MPVKEFFYGNRYRNKLIFLFFWALLFLLYAGNYKSRFLDYLDRWALFYDTIGYQGLLKDYLTVSLLFVYQLTNFLLYKILGFNGFTWNLVFTFLHALNAMLVFHLSGFFYQRFFNKNSFPAAFSAALLVVVCPYQTEVLAWGPTVHYLLSAAMILSAIWFSILYVESGKGNHLVGVVGLFTIGLFTHEITLVLPLLLIALFVLGRNLFLWKNAFGITFLKLTIPLFALTGVLFALNKIILGKWIGHYGAETHLNFSIASIGSAACKYFMKFFLFASAWGGEWRMSFYAFLNKPVSGYVFIALCLSMVLFSFFMLRHKFPKATVSLVFLTMFMIALLPVLNLYFPSWTYIMGDRLGYLASMFFYPFLVSLIFMLPKAMRFSFISLAVVVSVYFLLCNIQSWRTAGKIATSLENDFRWFNDRHIYILCMPDNYRGAHMYRLTETKPFTENIRKAHGVDLDRKTTEILKYNMMAFTDSVSVEIVSDTSLKVTLSEWGRWFWRFGEGATNYETESYKVEIDEYGHAYLLSFKRKLPDAVYIYQSAGHWNQVSGF